MTLQFVENDTVGEFPELDQGHQINWAARISALGQGGQIIMTPDTPCSIPILEADHDLDHRPTECAYPWKNRRIRDFDTVPRTVLEILYYQKQKPLEPGTRYCPDWYLHDQNLYVPRPAKEAQVFEALKPKGMESRFAMILANGGMGKTRLAAHCAAQVAGDYPDGVFFAELAFAGFGQEAPADIDVSALLWEQSEIVRQHTENRLPIPETPNESDLDQRLMRDLIRILGETLSLSHDKQSPAGIRAALQDKRILLILDNFESVACPATARFLTFLLQTNHLCLLLTTRSAAGPGDVGTTIILDDGMKEDEAVALFEDRARVAYARRTDANRHPYQSDTKAIAAIAFETGYIPLMIEIAATGRIYYSEAEILSQLQSNLMIASPRNLPPLDSQRTAGRHDAMENTLQLVMESPRQTIWWRRAANTLCYMRGIHRHLQS